MTVTDTDPGADTGARPSGRFKAFTVRAAVVVIAAGLAAGGGLYALDRVDAAVDRSAQAQVEAIQQAGADQVEIVTDLFNQGVDNNNARIDELNESIRSANRMLDSMEGDCFGYRVDGAIQQNGCFLQYIVQMLPHLIG